MYRDYVNIRICGVATSVPDNFIEHMNYATYIEPRMIARQDKLTGITGRYCSFENQTLSDLLIPAATHLMKKCDTKRDDVKAVIVATETPDYIRPATACYIQNRLGIPAESVCIDINQGCAGAAVGIQLICSLLQGEPSGSKGLLCMGNCKRDFREPEKMPQRTLLDNMIFGAGAAVLEFEVVEQESKIVCETLSYGECMEYVYRKNDGTRVTDALKVVDFNHDIFAKGISGFKQSMGISDADIDIYLLNQSQKMIMDTVIQAGGLDREKVAVSVSKFGDLFSAAPFISLCHLREKLKKGTNKILLAVSGSGMTCGYAWFDIDSDEVFDVLYIKEDD